MSNNQSLPLIFSAVSLREAVEFLKGACRNWSNVPSLSEDDIEDVATELSRFVGQRLTQPAYDRGILLDTLQTELECLLEDLGTAEQSAVEGLMARINRIEAVIEKAGRS